MSIAEKLEQIAANEQRVYDAGYAAGQETSGSYEEGYEQGKIDGNISKYATAISFQNAVFPDGYEVTVSVQNLSALPLFRNAQGVSRVTIADISLDKQYSAQYFLYLSSVEEVVLIDGIRITGAGLMCNSADGLRSITGAMDMSGVNSSDLWGGCSALEEIRFVARTIMVNVGFQHSNKLSDASIQSIIDGLADLTGQTAQKVTFHTNALLKLTDEQVNTIGAKNWTF